MNTLLKECVQAKSNETRSMVGGTTRREKGRCEENGAQAAMDVGGRTRQKQRCQSLGRGADAVLTRVVAW